MGQPIIAAAAATIAGHAAPARQPDRRRRPRRRHRPCAATCWCACPTTCARFKRITLGAPIVMGRKTWDSIGRAAARAGATSSSRATRLCGAEAPRPRPRSRPRSTLAATAPRVYVIGGAEIYALALPIADELLLTEIDAEFAADTFFPAWDRRRFAQTAREPHETRRGRALRLRHLQEADPGRLTCRITAFTFTDRTTTRSSTSRTPSRTAWPGGSPWRPRSSPPSARCSRTWAA